MMTLGRLALAVGRLVDFSIEVLENTVRHLRMGKSPLTAAKDAAEEVAMSGIVSTIATVVVFFPVVLIAGLGRFHFSPLALSVAFDMVASYALALTLIPAYSSHFVRPEKELSMPRQSLWATLSSMAVSLRIVIDAMAGEVA
jgi:HAE1 family hydrophobic/amphiphilic exporter-1